MRSQRHAPFPGNIFNSHPRCHPAQIYSTAPVRINPDLPDELERIVNKALEKDRNLRYQSASELRVDLNRLERDLSTAKATAAQEPASRESVRFPRRHPMPGKWRFALAALLLIILIGSARPL